MLKSQSLKKIERERKAVLFIRCFFDVGMAMGHRTIFFRLWRQYYSSSKHTQTYYANSSLPVLAQWLNSWRVWSWQYRMFLKMNLKVSWAVWLSSLQHLTAIGHWKEATRLQLITERGYKAAIGHWKEATGLQWTTERDYKAAIGHWKVALFMTILSKSLAGDHIFETPSSKEASIKSLFRYLLW